MRKMIDRRYLTASLFLGVVLPACALEPMDENLYRDGFTHINKQPFVSDLVPDKLIDVWVSADQAIEYSKVLLDGQGSGVHLRPDTVIVREVLDAAGEIQTLTIMIKREPGYYPGGGDYWYGVADPDGTVRNDDNGNPLMGPLTQCGDCHASRANDDFLFGIPSGYHTLR